MRQWCAGLVGHASWSGLTLQQSQACLDVYIGWVKLSCPGICVQSIVGLIVARLILVDVSNAKDGKLFTTTTYQCTKIVPNLGDVGIQTNGTRVCIKSVTVLIDLVVQNTDGAPECWVPAITINSLLVGLVRLWVFLLRHVAAAQQIPTLSVGLICDCVSVCVCARAGVLRGSERLVNIPELTDFSKYSMACS